MKQARPMHTAEETNRIRDERSARPAGAHSYSTDALFQGAREIEIEHHGEVYRLRITRQGKLILNK